MKTVNSGIDKIKFILNPFFLNNHIPHHIRADNALTIHRAGIYIFLAIHAEYCNPCFDYQITIAQALFELMQRKVINFPTDYPVFTFLFVLQHFDYFVLGVSQIEFYFDFPKNKVSIDPDAIENGDVIQFANKDGTPTDTFYSNDYIPGKCDSSWIVYNKRLKHIHDNRIKRNKIENMNVEDRIEGRLNRENCSYLDIHNLAGTYEDIFKKFLPFLAVSFYVHLFPFTTVKGRSNTHYGRLVRKAREGKRQYFNRNRLVKSEKVQKIPENGTARKQMQKMILENYYKDMENAKNVNGMAGNDNKMGEIADLALGE